MRWRQILTGLFTPEYGRRPVPWSVRAVRAPAGRGDSIVKILIITWYFPPQNEVASGRPYSWATHFVRSGHSVTVLTPQKDPSVHGPLTMPFESMPGLRIIETPLRLRRTPVGKAISWAVGSVGKVIELAREHDVVITSYPHGHIPSLGRVAKISNPSLFWCADYRDLWHDNYFFTEGKPIRRAVLRVVEKLLMSPSRLTVTVSEPLAVKLRNTFPRIPSAVIYNGFPEQDYRESVAASRIRERHLAGAPFRILYTGTIYIGYQDPEPLFAALSRGGWQRPVRLSFFGQCTSDPLLHRLRQKYALQEVVELSETRLDRIASVGAQREADLLFHMGWTDRKNDGWLSGKVFEYMASGVPTLSVGADPDSALGGLLTDTGTGVCIRNDVDRIFRDLDEMINHGRVCDWYRPVPARIRQFSREAQASAILELLLAALAKPARGRSESKPMVPGL